MLVSVEQVIKTKIHNIFYETRTNRNSTYSESYLVNVDTDSGIVEIHTYDVEKDCGCICTDCFDNTVFIYVGATKPFYPINLTIGDKYNLSGRGFYIEPKGIYNDDYEKIIDPKEYKGELISVQEKKDDSFTLDKLLKDDFI